MERVEWQRREGEKRLERGGEGGGGRGIEEGKARGE